MFWTTVAAAYLLLLGLGLALGHYLGSRFPRRGGGHGVGPAPSEPPLPPLPRFGLDWPPLGSDFDRALVPAAFSPEPVGHRR